MASLTTFRDFIKTIPEKKLPPGEFQRGKRGRLGDCTRPELYEVRINATPVASLMWSLAHPAPKDYTQPRRSRGCVLRSLSRVCPTWSAQTRRCSCRIERLSPICRSVRARPHRCASPFSLSCRLLAHRVRSFVANRGEGGECRAIAPLSFTFMKEKRLCPRAPSIFS